MDQLVEANTISNEVEEDNSTTFLDGKMIELDDEKESMMPRTPCLKDAMTDEEEEGTKLARPRIETCSNDSSNTPKKIGST
jgi:hypothetical protein